MPSYLHPGVYVEEISSGSKPIEGVATSIAAFVGVTQRNSQHDPVLIGNINEYMDLFGPIMTEDDAMGLAVQAFYRNGGGSCYICPMSTASTSGSATFGDVSVSADGSGPWSEKIYIRITDVSATTFDLEVGTHNEDDEFVRRETYNDANMDSTSENYVETLINGLSRYITVSVDGSALPIATDDKGSKLEGGSETSPSSGDYATFYEDELRKIRDVSIIVLPGQSWPSTGGNAVISETRAHCDKMKNRVVIIDPAENLELTNSAVVTAMGLPTSTYSTLYYPWVGVANPLYHEENNPKASKTINVAPSAIAAGMWAKIDGKRGIWKAPAGVETQLTGASSLRFKVENKEQDQLNPLGINCIRTLPNYGSVFWGSRTLATKADPEWRYVPVRRTATYIEESIYNGIQWAVFEPNDEPLWSSLRANIGAFMNGMFRAGAFQGQKASDAYFVRCGLGDTMTQGDVDAGRVIINIGFAPLKPAEFVIVRIQQKVGQE